MNLSISFLGAVHTLLSIYAMWVGGVALWRRKGGTEHRRRGIRYVIASMLVNLTALGIYAHGVFRSFHWMALFTLLSLLLAFAAARWRRPRGAWLRIHLTAIVYSYYMLWGGLVNVLFLRVPVLHALPPYVLQSVHSAVLLIAIAGIIYFWVSFSRERTYQ